MAGLKGAQRMVLQAISDLPTDPAGYVSDSQIAQETQIAIGDVRDWIETLEGDGLVEVARTQAGLRASITAQGRLALGQYRPVQTTSPGRVAPLDTTTAGIARDPFNGKGENMPGTAEQIAEKLAKHPRSVAYLDELIKGVSEPERARLLGSILPERYLSLPESGETSLEREAIRKCFRMVFDMVADATKRAFVSNYHKMLRVDNDERIGRYERAFYRGKDLRYAEVDERNMVKKHLLDTLEESMSRQYLWVLEGIGEYLEPSEVGPFFASTMALYHVSHMSYLTRRNSMRFLRKECGMMSNQVASEARRLLRSYLEISDLTEAERKPFVGILDALEKRFD